MNKKFLSVALFGALLVASAGTFTSCKDYDDDINGLNSRVDAVEKSLSELNTKFGSLAYVKSVSFTDGKLTVTDQNGVATPFIIPDKDTNTTYTLDVKQNGNKATITLTDDKGVVQTKEISFTDTDTKFDPSLLWMDESGVVWYGDKNKPAECKQAGMTVPLHDKTEVSVIKLVHNGVNIGWDIAAGNVTTHLSILDVLPITSFEYIPENVLAGWGERVIVFEENSYMEKKITADVVAASSTSLYMSNIATPQYQVNPSSASIAQLADAGKPAILKKTVSQVTRTPGTFIEWKKTTINEGVMTVSLEADPAMFANANDKLDLIALQFGTTANNKITTEYVGVINKAAKVDLRFTNAAVTETNAGNYDNHFAMSKASAVNQKALIDNVNMPLVGNDPLVQNVPYTKATTTGIDLNELISICNVGGTGHKFFDYAKYPDLKLTFEAVAYNVGQTPQEKYMSLDGSTFKAVNYNATNPSCIGKAPMVLAKLTDSHNGNALVAAAYIKLLIVADAAAQPEEDITINKDANIGIGCNNPVYSWKTNDEFMSTQVYTFTANDKLTALSKEQFHNLYTYTAGPVAGYTNVGTWTVTESLSDGTDGKKNHEVKFDLTTAPLKAQDYIAYAVYTKTTDPATLTTVVNGGMYPEHVVIKHTVKVDAVNFTATSKERVVSAWEGDKAAIYCQTPGTTNTTQIVGDLNELFVGGKVQFAYSSTYDAAKYPSFAAANMEYAFVFSAKNLKATRNLVTGVDGTQYQLALSADNTKLYAVGKDLTGAAITAACIPANLVASLSGTNNKDVTYANTVAAKNLLNIAPRGDNSFYAIMDIVYANGCDQPVDVTDGEFKLAFIRPVNVASDASKFFTDGLNENDPANVLKMGELVGFTDWRKAAPLNSFASNKDYYRYYGVTSIKCDDIKKVETDWTGTRLTLEKAFGADLADQIISFDPKTVTYTNTVTAVPDFGTVTYIKSSRVEIKDYKLYIPLTITYKWGTIKETITVQVKATK